MPAETAAHERTLMAWPTGARRDFWQGHLEDARDAWAEVARAVAASEPVTMVVAPGEADGALARLGAAPGVDLVEHPIDDSWMRDTGPVVLSDPCDSARRVAVHFGFNAWGGLVEPWDSDAAVAALLATDLGLPLAEAGFVFEGGSVVVDGEGLAVTTRRSLLHASRGPLPNGRVRTEAAMDELLADWLGATEAVWLSDGLADDTDTDGHVDNVVALPRPGLALLQGCDDPDDPDAATSARSRRLLAEAGLIVVELAVLPRTECFGREVEVPYLNLYAGNGFVVVPVTGDPYDAEALDVIGALYPGREVRPVPGAVIAYGGGGPHCTTQQVPAATAPDAAVPAAPRSAESGRGPWS